MTGWRCRSCWCAEVAEFVHPRLGPVEVVRSPRARRITLSVRASGTVRLSHPWHTARARALEFLDSRVEWVMAARERMARRQAALPRMSPEGHSQCPLERECAKVIKNFESSKFFAT